MVPLILGVFYGFEGFYNRNVFIVGGGRGVNTEAPKYAHG